MARVVVMEQVRIGEWNEKRMKQNDQDEADGMKQEVNSKDSQLVNRNEMSDCDFKSGVEEGWC